IAAAQEVGGSVSMNIGAFYFDSKDDVTQFLWFKFSSSQIDVYKAAQTMTLNLQVYDKVRAAVLEKLGNLAQDYVNNISI
ncbi:MAG TPA: hypothetical protein VEI50_09375, partial [Nitrospiraceae bacterium]|nr:hypothetical protein [Nitrospiraceae bacterium]